MNGSESIIKEIIRLRNAVRLAITEVNLQSLKKLICDIREAEADGIIYPGDRLQIVDELADLALMMAAKISK